MPDGVVVASVMSWLGTWRQFLQAITELEGDIGEQATDQVPRTGDLRHAAGGPGAHICRMFRWSDLQALVERAGGRVLGSSASNWASLGDAQTLERLEADPARWQRFLEHELAACAQPGALDGGTHILFAAARAAEAAPAPRSAISAARRA